MQLECRNVDKTIKGSRVLKQISLQLKGGSVYGLWGKNGCGKTMLMRVLSNLIYPTEGQVLVNGTLLKKNEGYPVSIGALIENPAFLDGYTGLENLRILAAIRGKIGEEEIRKALLRVGLDPEDKRKYRKYSLGMKQRLGIACAMMEEPEALFLDEPINALDEDGVMLVRRLLREQTEKGSLVLLACHDREELFLLADEVYYMEEGKICRHQKKNSEGDWIELEDRENGRA